MLAPYGQCMIMGCCKILTKDEKAKHVRRCSKHIYSSQSIETNNKNIIIKDSKKSKNIK